MRSKTIGVVWKPYKELDAIDKLYRSSAWLHGTSPIIRRLNPLCQVVSAEGRRCKNPATEVHHIVSPRVDIQRFHDPSNLVALCHSCHKTTEGEDPNSNRTFVPTIDSFGVRHAHECPKPLAKGEVRILADGTCQVGL
jgi:5-methylcytosine-specific restriction endonuclease McrA